MPNRCPFVRNEALKEEGFRWVAVRNYTIFFKVDEKAKIVRIWRILYSKRKYDELL